MYHTIYGNTHYFIYDDNHDLHLFFNFRNGSKLEKLYR